MPLALTQPKRLRDHQRGHRSECLNDMKGRRDDPDHDKRAVLAGSCADEPAANARPGYISHKRGMRADSEAGIGYYLQTYLRLRLQKRGSFRESPQGSMGDGRFRGLLSRRSAYKRHQYGGGDALNSRRHTMRRRQLILPGDQAMPVFFAGEMALTIWSATCGKKKRHRVLTSLERQRVDKARTVVVS